MKWVYEFSEGSREQRELLGGKGANVAEMTRVLGADRVPAGFTITTEACVAYMEAGREPPEGLADQVDEALAALERSAGKRLGDPDDPLLVSVRSGARVSMPGMLDTVLNLGLNDESVAGLARSTDDERFAWDAYRRFVQMFGNVVEGIPGLGLRVRARGGEGAGRGRGGHRARRRDPAGADRDVRANVRGAHRRAVPERATAPARAGDHGGLRLLGRRARGRLPPHQRHPRRLGHGGQRAADGLRQSRPDLGLRGRVQPRRAHRRADAVRRLPRQRPGRGRGRRAPATRRTSTPSPSACPRPTPSCSPTSRPSRPTTRTCRTSSSRSRRAGSTCCRPAARSALPRPPSGSRATPCAEGLLTRERALLTIDADALEALLHPIFDPEHEFRVLTTGVAASPGRGQGRDRAQRGGGGAPRRRRRGRHPRAPVHRGRRRRRIQRRSGNPHRPGGQGLARGARRARHGPAVRRRRVRGQGRRRRRPSCGSARSSSRRAIRSRSRAPPARSPTTTSR